MMFTYVEPTNPPATEEICLFKLYETPFSPDAILWTTWIESQGEIITQIHCCDGVVFVIREKR